MKKTISGIQVGDVTIYTEKLPDRKKPSMIVQKKGVASIYGTFTNDEAAQEFFRILAETLGMISKEKTE